MIELYTRSSCPRCDDMKRSLSANGVTYTERVLDSDVSTAEVVLAFPEAKMLPILSVGKHALGGVDELLALIRNDQLKYLT